MNSASAISADFLERIADPASRLHPDYLSYRNREITKQELVGRLPHVAMLGDSVCMGIYISSPWSTFWRTHTCRRRNWFADAAGPNPGIRSVSKRLEEITPFVITQYAGIGAMVDHEGCRPELFRRVLGTRALKLRSIAWPLSFSG